MYPIPRWGRVAAQISAELIPQQIFTQNEISIPFFVCYSQSIPFILSSIASLDSSFQALP